MTRLRPALNLVCCLVWLTVGRVFAADISGKIVLNKKLNKVAVVSGVYDLRGAATPDPSTLPRRGSFDHVAVWLENKTSPAAVPTTTQMRQLGRRFQPDLLILPIGSTVEFPNLDPIFHNIFSLSHAQNFDLGYYAQGKTRSVTFLRPGIVQVYCHIHADMYGVIVVAPTNWSGIPDEEGVFHFSRVLPGEYELAVWQKTAGLIRKKILVPDSGTFQVRIALPEESPE